jgi:hypothetical protein
MKWFRLAPLLLFIFCQASRADDLAPADLRAFGKLPIYFNGRVTTLDHYAQNSMRRISGSATWQDQNGKSQPAISWLLDLICGDDATRDVRIVRIENGSLLTLFELPGRQGTRYSIIELLPKMELFAAEANRARRSPKPTPDETAAVDLAERLELVLLMAAVFQPPDYSDNETMVAALRRSLELEGRPIPFLIPPKDPGGPWGTLTRELIVVRTTKETGVEPNPAGTLYAGLIDARQKQDAAAFHQSLKELRQRIDDLKLAACPLKFQMAPRWYEVGTPRLGKQYLFGDTQTFGTTVASFHLMTDEGTLMAHLHFFPTGAASRESIVNQWRQTEGWAPLPLDRIRTTPVQIAGQPGWQVEIESAEVQRGSTELLHSFGVTIGNQTWVVAGSGPKALMIKHRRDIDRLVESLQIESPESAEKWLNLDPPEPQSLPAGSKVSLAVIPDGKHVWLLRGNYFAENHPDQQLEKLRTVLKSIRFRQAGNADAAASELPFEWTLPDGWMLEESATDLPAVVCRSEPPFVAIQFQRLKVEGDLQLPILINQWRSECRVPELPADKLVTETISVEKRDIVFVVVEGP